MNVDLTGIGIRNLFVFGEPGGALDEETWPDTGVPLRIFSALMSRMSDSQWHFPLRSERLLLAENGLSTDPNQTV